MLKSQDDNVTYFKVFNYILTLRPTYLMTPYLMVRCNFVLFINSLMILFNLMVDAYGFQVRIIELIINMLTRILHVHYV